MVRATEEMASGETFAEALLGVVLANAPARMTREERDVLYGLLLDTAVDHVKAWALKGITQ